MNEYFKEQIAGGAADQFFYGTEQNGEVRIERHRGTLETLSLDGLVFDRMMGSTPMFRPINCDNALSPEQRQVRKENRKEIMRNMGYSRIGRNNV
jgi:hypothetical protein